MKSLADFTISILCKIEMYKFQTVKYRYVIFTLNFSLFSSSHVSFDYFFIIYYGGKNVHCGGNCITDVF